MLLKVYGADMAATATYPHNGINGGLRAAVRAGSYGKPGFIFVNNYERLAASMPVHENVRFQLDWPESNSSMTIPSANIPGVNVSVGRVVCMASPSTFGREGKSPMGDCPASHGC